MAPSSVGIRRKNRFLRMNFDAKNNARRQDLKDSIHVVIASPTYDETHDILPISIIQDMLPRHNGNDNQSNTSGHLTKSNTSCHLTGVSDLTSCDPDDDVPGKDLPLSAIITLPDVQRSVVSQKRDPCVSHHMGEGTGGTASGPTPPGESPPGGERAEVPLLRGGHRLEGESRKRHSSDHILRRKKGRTPGEGPTGCVAPCQSLAYAAEEYSEDLAQLDMLLHYVNNLSASLEFLDWEKNKRISTDLVPTLLDIYDAIYAKFSDENSTAIELQTEETPTCKDQLPSGEKKESGGSEDLDTDPSIASNSFHHPPTTQIPPPSPQVEKKLHIPSTSSPLIRPLSSISSSSSSSSSNSLPRQWSSGGTPSRGGNIHASTNMAYLASVESLNNNDEEEEGVNEGNGGGKVLMNRRDLKANHLSRPGSCDSGVVHCHSMTPPTPLRGAGRERGATTPHMRGGEEIAPQRGGEEMNNNNSSQPMTPRHGRPSPHFAHMDRLVLEVQETEALYVQGLTQVIQGYLEPWLDGTEAGVEANQALELFSNLKEIHHFNSLFLSELEECGTDPVQVARVFVNNNAGFTIYTHYCTHYPRTVSLLTELMRKESSVASFRRRQLSLGHTLPLGSYLLKPVQRILKYHLLLENILKHFDKEADHAGYNMILSARNAMTGMAHHINDMKRKHEHCVRVQEIQSLLYGWPGADLTTFGELAAEGAFRLLSAKGLRHVFLFSRMLLICKKKEENILVYKTHILCSNLMLIESIPREPLCFQVIPFDNPRVQYTLLARNRDHKHEWTQQLKRLILENYSAKIPAHARQLVMELGRAKQDECSLPSSAGRRAPLSSGPEYLQRRKRRGRRASDHTPTNGGRKLRLRKLSTDSDANRSRSASRGRDTEEEEEEHHPHKQRLRLNMWRRKSEPSSPLKVHKVNPLTDCVDAPSTPTTHYDATYERTGFGVCEDVTYIRESQGEESPQINLENFDLSQNESEENLEEIVSHLLKHNLQLQQMLLSKQRRGLISRKKIPTNYETSDTENDDLTSNDRSLNSVISLDSMDGVNTVASGEFGGSNNSVLDSIGVSDAGVRNGSINLYFNTERERLGSKMNGKLESPSSSSEGASVYGSALSIRKNSKEILSGYPSQGVMDFSVRRRGLVKKSSNENKSSGLWSSLRGLGHRKDINSNASLATIQSDIVDRSSVVRRVHSFSSDIGDDRLSEEKVTKNNASQFKTECDSKDRPVTIALYENEEVADSGCLPKIVSDKNTRNSNHKIDDKADLQNVYSHPDHKIYSKANLSKSSLKNVIAKLTSNRKYCSETLDNQETYEQEKTPSKLVYSMAKHCSKSLKERIKQIKSEDETRSNLSNSPRHLDKSQIYVLPQYQQDTDTIGAKLASCEIDASEYQLHKTSSETASNTFESQDLSSSKYENYFLDQNLDDSSGSLDDFDENCYPEDESFYEKSFEVIEDMLETDLFRDSAIYSDPEDADGKTNPVDLKHLPKSVLNRVSKSPSLRSDKCKVVSLNGILETSDSNSEVQVLDEAINEGETEDIKKPNSQSIETVVQLDLSSVHLQDIEYADQGLDDSHLISTVDESNHEISSPEDAFNTEVQSLDTNPSKKVPPPVPAKPDIVKNKVNRNYGNKILTHLKNLEESSKYSKSAEKDASLDGLKSIEQRRKELTSPKLDGEKGNEYEHPRVKSSKSTRLSSKSFAVRSVGSSANSRQSRSTERSTSNNKQTPDSSHKVKEELSSTKKAYQAINLSRKKSIKSLRSYVSKINSRSSSVPPQLSERLQSRQSSLPTEISKADTSVNDSESSEQLTDELSYGGIIGSLNSSKSCPESFSEGGSSTGSSSDVTSGVVIESKQPKGWVKHVVGKLQQVEKSTENSNS